MTNVHQGASRVAYRRLAPWPSRRCLGGQLKWRRGGSRAGGGCEGGAEQEPGGGGGEREQCRRVEASRGKKKEVASRSLDCTLGLTSVVPTQQQAHSLVLGSS